MRFLFFRVVLITSFELIDDVDGLIERRLMRIADVIDSKIGKSGYVGAVFLHVEGKVQFKEGRE